MNAIEDTNLKYLKPGIIDHFCYQSNEQTPKIALKCLFITLPELHFNIVRIILCLFVCLSLSSLEKVSHGNTSLFGVLWLVGLKSRAETKHILGIGSVRVNRTQRDMSQWSWRGTRLVHFKLNSVLSGWIGARKWKSATCGIEKDCINIIFHRFEPLCCRDLAFSLGISEYLRINLVLNQFELLIVMNYWKV